MSSFNLNSNRSMRQRLSRLVGPALAVIVLYGIVFYMPQRRTLAERIAKHDKLNQQVTRRAPEHAVLTNRAATAEAEERKLAQELRSSKDSGAHLVVRRADRRAQVFSPTSPASQLAETLQLLDRHGLVCLDSSLAQRHAKFQGDSLEALKPVADLLGVAPGEEIGCREVRIKLWGRFQELQTAIHEIQRDLSQAFIVSLEMEPTELHHSAHTWYLTISL